MKVKVNKINMRCILMTEAVTVSNMILIAIASLVSDYMAADGRTDRQTDYLASSMLTF